MHTCHPYERMPQFSLVPIEISGTEFNHFNKHKLTCEEVTQINCNFNFLFAIHVMQMFIRVCLQIALHDSLNKHNTTIHKQQFA